MNAYTPEEVDKLFNAICLRIAQGESLVRITQDKDMPHYSTVARWLSEDAAKQERYARAREEQADYFADQIVGIADTEEDANRARVRVDARKWAASKLKPKVYGERLNVDGDLRITLTNDQLDSRIAQLLGKAGIAGVAGGTGQEGEGS